MFIKLLKAKITILFLVLPYFISIQAATVTWTGATDTDWDTGTNWDTGAEPTASDDVTIPTGLTNYPLINSIDNTVQSVEIIGLDASLEIASGAELKILNSPGVGLSAEGSLLILGTLNITNSAGNGLENIGEVTVYATGDLEITGTLGTYGIDNTYDAIMFTNLGIINIEDAGTEGLFNGAEFLNNNEINISGSFLGTGLSNDDIFDNFGTISINTVNNPEGGGMLNSNTFTNGECARVISNRRINTVASTFDNLGILILNGTGNNNGTFNNTGIIYNPNSAGLTTSGSGAVYTNLTTLSWTGCGGTIDWDEAFNWSLEVEPSNTYDVIISNANGGTLTSFVDITTAENSAKSVQILSTGDLEITSSGALSISNAVNNGLHILGTFFNAGTLSITNSGGDGLRNEALNITNQGEINISGAGDDGFFNQLSGSFNNTGTINIEGNTSESGIDNRGPFANEGEISINTVNSPTDGSIWNVSTFENVTCAAINVNDEIDNGGATAFNNNGLITSTFNGSNEGTIINDGVIYNLNGGTFTTSGGSNGFVLTSISTTVWNNCDSANTNWANNGNWTANTPDNSKTAIVPQGVNFYPVVLGNADVNELTIEANAEVNNEATLNAVIIDNSGILYNDNCGTIINITNNLTNNASGEIFNFGTINLLGDADFIDNGIYNGFAPDEAPPSIIFVDKDAIAGNDDGTSWEDAFLDLQDAFAFATSCNVVTEIWVAQGTYKPTTIAEPTAAFVLQNNLAIYGGFSGNGTETLLGQRDIANNVTILSGDVNNSNTSDTGDSHHIIEGNNKDNTAILDGFTIQHAFGNSSGGGITLTNGSPSIRNCIFQNNAVPGSGAGLFSTGGSPLVVNCKFINNIASTGGGIACFGGTPIFVNCIFEGNSSTGGGAGMYLGSSSTVTITNCLFFDQNSDLAGGGIFGINSDITVINSTFTDNTSRSKGSISTPNTGGGIFVNGGSLTAENCIFWNNFTFNTNDSQTTEIDSGLGAVVSVSNSIWQDNTSGGTIYDVNPLFANPTLDNFTLRFCSPAIGLGNNAALPIDAADVDEDENTAEQIEIDLNGDNRISDVNVDLGPYENSDEASPSFVEWDGEASTDWTNPLNWCPDVVPTVNDHVTIGNVDAPNYPVIDSDIGTITSLDLVGGSLTINASGTITLDNSTAHGISILGGTLTNDGNIFISNTQQTGLICFGEGNKLILNNGSIDISNTGDEGINLGFTTIFSNNDGGTVSITNTGLDGLLVQGSVDFNNNNGAILNISEAGENGLSRQGNGDIFNGGAISILQVEPAKKLATTSISIGTGAGALYNVQCASITFDDVLENNGTIATDGIIHANGLTFTNTGTFLQGSKGIIFDPNDIFDTPGGSFVNQGTIINDTQENSTANIWTGCAEDMDWDTANNWSLGVEPAATHDVIIPNMGESSNYPIVSTSENFAKSVEIQEYAEFSLATSSSLTIDGGSNGVFVSPNAVLSVESNASLTINNATNDGIENQGTVTIEGILTIDNSTDRNIYNLGSFTTGNCSQLSINGKLVSSSDFTNAGLLETTFDGLNEISGTFINDGVIYDVFDSFNTGADVSNNDLIMFPLSGCFGADIPEVLMDGGTDLIVASDWGSGESEIIGGTYDEATNTFSPNYEVLGIGTHYLLVSIEDSWGECFLYVEVEVTIEGCEDNFVWTGGSDPANSDWNDADNWTNGIVPSLGNVVTIPDIAPLTNYPVIDELVDIGGVIIEDNAELTVANGGEILIFFSDTGIDIGVGASLAVEEGGSVAVIEAATTGINVEGTLNVNGVVFVVSNGVGINVAATGTVNDNGFIQINQGFGGVEPEKTGVISVVNFLEIQNGGTFEVADGDTLLIDGSQGGGEKKLKAADGDIGIKIFDGGTFTSQNMGVTQVINITGTGIDNEGDVNNSGEMTITAETTGITTSNTFTNDGNVNISKSEETFEFKKTGGASVVNFLEIQNGGTFELTDDGNLTIDGEDVGPTKKMGLVNDDTGIDVNNGGTFTSEPNTSTEIINMSGLSTGIVTNGTVDNGGDMNINVESTGIQVQSGTTENGGEIIISKIDGLSFAAKQTGGASVVNFLEIQNGGTFELTDGGSLVIDGESTGGSLKAGKINTDVGISIASGGTFTSEDNTSTQILNMTDSSTGVETSGSLNNGGEFDIASDNVGISVQSGTVNNTGDMEIGKATVLVKKTGGASVVNFLEIQNGGTFEMNDDGTLIIDGDDSGGGLKSGVLSNDTGISVESGGTLTTEPDTNIEVNNMLTGSKGIVNSGDIDNSGTVTVTTENIGLQVNGGGTVDNDGTMNISKVVGNSGINDFPEDEEEEGDGSGDIGVVDLQKGMNTGGASVVNFLEIQNGGTFSVLSGGSLVIDGQDSGADGLKSSKALLNDTGIAVNSGGTFIAETDSDVDVINMVGSSIGVSTSGTVNNDGDFDITTEGKGIEVQAGTVSNGGDLDISKIEGLTFLSKKTGGASVVNFLEIQNGGTFSVLSGSSLTIDGAATLAKANSSFSNDVGIDVNAGGTFEAQDSSTVNVINMIGTSTGVVNNGELDNGGDFTITTENVGLQAQSDTVEVSGTLTITTVDAGSKSLNKKGAASVVNFLEIQNGGTFEILQGGQVTVDGLSGAAKKLNNDIGVNILSGGELITENEALLQIKNIIGEGTGMKNEGTVNNDGTIDIQEIGGNGLENSSDFNNNDCSVFSTDSKVTNDQLGEVVNQGLITSTYGSNGGQHVNDGMFVNEGVIEDPNNAFVNIIGNPIIESGDGQTNNYTLFTPLFTCYGEIINDATNKPLDTGGIYSVNMWYTDISLTEEAGVYEYSEIFGINRFTPNYNLLGPGVHLIYVSVESDNFADCGARNVVLVQLVIYPLPEVVPIHQDICVGETLTEALAVEDNGSDYVWYDQETGGTELTTGISYLPNPQPTESTTYWVEATNGNDCKSDGRTAVNFTIYDYPEEPTITSMATTGSCENVTILDAGTYPEGHTYLWSTTQTTQTIAVADLGAYTVTVSNQGDCSSTADIEVTEDPNFTIDIIGNTAYCLEGSVTLDAGSYSNNDTYIWSNNATTQTISATAGSYTVTVTNNDGCSDSDEVTVQSGILPTPPFTTATLTDNLLVCSEEIGAIYRLDQAYTQYQWNIVNGTATNNPNSGSGAVEASVDWAEGPAIGQVYVTVTDENGCKGTSFLEVNISSPVVASAIGDAICEGETATLTATGGGTYKWTTGETDASIEVMPTTNTTYTVTVTNSDGCTDTASAGVTIFPSVNATAIGDAICEDETATLTATGGGTYKWTTGETDASIEVMPTTNTTYTVTVTNGEGCTGTAEAEVTVLICCVADAGTVELVEEDLCGGDDILVTTNNTHQMADDYDLYYLLVDDFSGMIEGISTDGMFSDVVPDGYEVYSYVELNTNPPIPSPVGNTNLLISDIGTTDEGCYDLSDAQNVVMPENPGLEVEFTSTENNVSVTYFAIITISGGTGPYDLDFTTSNGFATVNTFSPTYYSVVYYESSIWDLTITDSNDCVSSVWQLSSSDNPNIFLEDVIILKESCTGEYDGAIDITLTGGASCDPTPNYTYVWSGPDSFTASTEDIFGLAAGDYHVTVSDCEDNSYTETFEVELNPTRRSRGRGRNQTLCGSVGSNKMALENDGEKFLQIRPNPFSYRTTIEFGIAETGIVNLTLYTLDGRKVKEIYRSLAENDLVNRIHFEADNIQPGMYLLQLVTESGEMVMEKLVVQ